MAAIPPSQPEQPEKVERNPQGITSEYNAQRRTPLLRAIELAECEQQESFRVAYPVNDCQAIIKPLLSIKGLLSEKRRLVIKPLRS